MDHFEFLIETTVFVLSRPIIHQLDDQLLYAMSIFSVTLRQDSQLRFSSIPIDPIAKFISFQCNTIIYLRVWTSRRFDKFQNFRILLFVNHQWSHLIHGLRFTRRKWFNAFGANSIRRWKEFHRDNNGNNASSPLLSSLLFSYFTEHRRKTWTRQLLLTEADCYVSMALPQYSLE